MRIGIDVRHLSRGPYTGVAEVTCRLIVALCREAPEDEFRIFSSGRKAPGPFLAFLTKRYRNARIRALRFPNRVFDLLARTCNAPKVDRLLGGVDVLFSPHSLVAPVGGTPRVLVLHDLSFVVHPEYFSPESRRWHAWMDVRRQAERAAAIIVPSHATARELERCWRIPRARVAVIAWGAPQKGSDTWYREESQPVNDSRTMRLFPLSGKRYVLFLGTIEKRKNALGLVRAFAAVKRDPTLSDVVLIFAGALGFGGGEVLAAAKASTAAADIEFRGYVSEEEKAALLAGASVFVYPSFYEGFGLPVLEAMAFGVPVITSAATSLPEVAGNAALLVASDRLEELSHAMVAVLKDPALAQMLSERGVQRAAQFTWENTAREVLGVLRAAAGRRNRYDGTNCV